MGIDATFTIACALCHRLLLNSEIGGSYTDGPARFFTIDDAQRAWVEAGWWRDPKMGRVFCPFCTPPRNRPKIIPAT